MTSPTRVLAKTIISRVSVSWSQKHHLTPKMTSSTRVDQGFDAGFNLRGSILCGRIFSKWFFNPFTVSASTVFTCNLFRLLATLAENSITEGRCGIVVCTLAFGSIGHGFESEHRLLLHHDASALICWYDLICCSLATSIACFTCTYLLHLFLSSAAWFKL